MNRFPLLLALATLVLVGIGCSTTYGQGTVYDRRVPDYRRGDRHQSRYYDRLHHDVREYVQVMDRRLRLDQRQQQRIHRLLDDRAGRLLDRTHPRDHAYVYPFPRRLDSLLAPIAAIEDDGSMRIARSRPSSTAISAMSIAT